MKIDNIRDLKQIIALCRKTGIQSIKVDNVEFHLGPMAKAIKSSKSVYTTDAFDMTQPTMPTFSPGGITEDTPIVTDDIETEELTPEQLLMWSANPEAGIEAKQ